MESSQWVDAELNSLSETAILVMLFSEVEKTDMEHIKPKSIVRDLYGAPSIHATIS